MTFLNHSAPDWCFFEDRGYEAGDYYRRLAHIGIGAVEMAPPGRWEAARRAGLEILNVSGPGMRAGLNRRENHAELIPQLRETIRLAADNNIPQVIIFSGNRGGMAADEGLENCVAAVSEIAPAAEEAGVTLAFEMLNSFDHKGYQADGTAFGFALAKGVGSPAVKILYDIYHMHRMGESEENIVADITENLDVIAHIHIAGSPKRDFPGGGQAIDYRRIVSALNRAPYRGYIGHEFLARENPVEELEAAVTLFESYARVQPGE